MYILCICIWMYMYELSGKREIAVVVSAELGPGPKASLYTLCIFHTLLHYQCFIYSKSYMNTLKDYQTASSLAKEPTLLLAPHM